jgi:hypothetical protein
MALNSTGPISLGGGTTGQSVNLELGKGATDTISMNDSNVRTLAGVPTGEITFNSFYGKSNVASPTPTPTRTPTPTITPSMSATPTPTPTRTPSASPPTIYLYGITYCNLVTSNISSADPLTVGVTYYSGIGCFTVDSDNGSTGGFFPDIPSGNATVSSCAASECSGGGPQQ